MAARDRKLSILATLTIIVLLVVVSLANSFSGIGITAGVGTEWGIPSDYNPAPTPQLVVEDAHRLATKLYGSSQEQWRDFVHQLLAMYDEARDSDFIVIFNSGGWGGNMVEESPGWSSILSSIEYKLDTSGYKPLLMNHRRTVESLRGNLEEAWQMLTSYPSKAEDLAYRVQFLTDHVPDINVILAGESTGTVICDRAMMMLEDNPQVYSIQTGPPFWHTSTAQERTLLLTDNGVVPDSFSLGDIPAMARANLRNIFGLAGENESKGRVLLFLEAPGHDYGWQYPAVYSQITAFLEENFAIK